MKLSTEAMDLHEQLRGKLYIGKKHKLDYESLALLYTPGVSEPCLKIAEQSETAYELTWKWNSVAVISDGTRVLGLGNIGPLASLPLLEGKALIFSKFGGIDAVPIPVSPKSADEMVEIIKGFSHGFGGINLEDICTPKCYELLEKLSHELDIPVWHDDQQGTATIIVSALFNAMEVTGRDLNSSKLVLFGAGAANTAVYRLLKVAGVDPSRIKLFNDKGILGNHRDDLMDVPLLKQICNETNHQGENISIEDAIKGADAIIGLSKCGPDVIKTDWIRSMSENPIVFACANPIPEIDPNKAKEAGAAVVATGRSDFPNQVNNALIFPGMYRGTLDVRASTISWEMCVAVAKEIALMAKEKGLKTDYIVPKLDEPDLHFRVARAAGLCAIEQGIAGKKFIKGELERVIRGNLCQEY